MFKNNIAPLVLLASFFAILLIGCKDGNAQKDTQTQVQPQTENEDICDTLVSTDEVQTQALEDDTSAVQAEGLPRMLELGSVGCIPCEKMTPILDGLRKDYAGVLSVEFFDVRKDNKPAQKYRIRLIPTQIFLDAGGNEFFRHEGFFAREGIDSVLADMGVLK